MRVEMDGQADFALERLDRLDRRDTVATTVSRAMAIWMTQNKIRQGYPSSLTLRS